MKRDVRILIIVSVVTALIMSACGQSSGESISQTSDHSTGTITILEWAGYDDPSFFEPFSQKNPDSSVDFSYFADDAEAYSKIQSGFDVDMIHPCSPWIGEYMRAGLIQPIDTSRLEHWSNINPSLAKIGQIDGVQYFIPWDFGIEGLLVRTDKVEQVPDSWNDLWDPQYKGHVSMLDIGETAWITTSAALGFDPYHTTPEQQEAIKQKLIDLKPNLLNYWADATELTSLMASGDVWVAGNGWVESYIALRDEGIPISFITPEEGALGFVCGYVITSSAKDLDLVYDYLNAVTSPQSMANMSNTLGYGPSNQAAIPLLDPKFVEELKLDDPTLMTRTIFYQPIDSDQRELFTNIWSEVKAAP